MTSNSRIALGNYLGARRELLEAMLADRRNGTSANDIARAVGAAWSRPVTLDYLSVWELREDAQTALTEAGLASWVGVRTTGDNSGPRRVLLQITCDPVDLDGPETWQSLPGRITDALATAQIGWRFTELEPSKDTTLNALLEDVEEVELHRI